MADARELIRAGRIHDARKILTEEIKRYPSDTKKRTILLQILCFLGEWGKAEKHLDVIALQDRERETGVQIYKNLINAEKERREVINNNLVPSFLTEPPNFFQSYQIARKRLADGKIEEAKSLFMEIFENQHDVSGEVDGRDFTGFRNLDTMLSLFIESFVYERYVWFPISSLREISINKPETFFDLLWIPTRLVTWEGLTVNCFLPVLYPDTYYHNDEEVILGRMTDWTDIDGFFYKGAGRQIFQIGDEEVVLLDFREIVFKIQ